MAIPPMGAGFYGIPLDMCARVMLEVIKKHILDDSSLEEVIICVLDEREFKAFQDRWQVFE